MATTSQPDDNMIPGQTYTFQMKSSNLVLLPSTNTVQQDLMSNAPSFVGNDLQVTSPFTTSLYNVQFTYNGDGTDVISDVANSIIAACQTGSNDGFVFVGAVASPASAITVSVSSAAQTAADSIGGAINSATQGAAKAASDAAQTILTPIEIALAIVIGLVVVLIFTSGKAGGVSASETGVSVGGAK